ncbi:hypothetical protein [Kitasatospora sp. NPDC006786]|uniref:hypothetical protein n=1 Tax=unclassified Kitasatospora TaxID=2633591 RepID=UPI0033D6A924
MALLLALTGCSPAPEPTVGLQRDGDGYAVVVPLCPNGEVLSVSVWESSSGARAEWTVSSDGANGAIDRFPLFVTPPGWTAGDHDLTALKPGTSYGTGTAMAANTRDTDFGFTLADLEKLKGDEVLTLKKGGGTTRLKARKFRANALTFC